MVDLSALDRILAMDAFHSVFQVLKEADSTNGEAIRTALETALKGCHEGARTSGGKPDRLRYWLLREAVEVKAQAAPFLNYEREMAQRQAALWQFALVQTESLFGLIFGALDEYFDAKTELIIGDVEKDASWYAGLRDHAKKTGLVVKSTAGLLRRVVDRLRKDNDKQADADGFLGKTSDAIGEFEAIDIRDSVQKAVETHLSEAILRDDLEKILKEAAERYEEGWVREIRTQTPDLRQLEAFSKAGVAGPSIASCLDFGLTEQTLAIGMAGAVVGTLSLAAGWHVLAYAMVHVFYPMVIVTVIATLGIAVWRREEELEKRRRQVREIVDQYHRHFVLAIDLERLDALDGRTLREAIADSAKKLVLATVEHWEQSIGGNLRTQHYRLLGEACTAHLDLVESVIKALPTDPSE